MKEFVEKLIGRLEEEKNRSLIFEHNAETELNEQYFSGKRNAFAETIDFTNELAEEYKDKYVSRAVFEQVVWENNVAISQLEELGYGLGEKISKSNNNDWIPCSERLPKEHGQYLVTVKNLSGFYILEDTVFVCDYAYNEFDFQGWEDNEVIAWQPLPEPYQKGENE